MDPEDLETLGTIHRKLCDAISELDLEASDHNYKLLENVDDMLYALRTILNQGPKEMRVDSAEYRMLVDSLPDPQPVEREEQDKSWCGIFQINDRYALFDAAEKWSYTHKWITASIPIHVMATGKVFRVRNQIVAVEIFYASEGRTKVCWTIPSVLDRPDA